MEWNFLMSRIQVIISIEGGIYLKDIYSANQIARLEEIRKYLALKEKYAPYFLSAEEFGEWEKCHKNYFLHRGYLSIWDGIEVPSGIDEVVIKKGSSKGGIKPYLVFSDAEAFYEYCRNAYFLGIESFAFLEDKFIPQIESLAQKYSVPAAACDGLQSEVEKFVGLNFTADAAVVSNEQLYGSLYNYYKRAVESKAGQIFVKYGVVINIDISEWEPTLSLENYPESAYISHADLDTEEIDPKRLLFKIIDLMDKLENKKDSKFDMKDNLLSQVVRSDHATKEFLSSYYAALKDRRSVWRPAAFSYQVHFAHDNGVKYLKNPTFIQTCGDTSIGEMIESQINTYKSTDINEKALGNMYSILNRMRDENIQNTTLAECAGGSGQNGKAPEQIGKALSKELRTEEARGSLARALLVSVLERSEAAYYSADVKGEDYHE